MPALPELQEYPRGIPFRNNELPLYIGVHRVAGNIAPHYHPLAELTLVLEGSGRKTVNGKTHRMKPGAVCLYLPHHVHGSEHEAGEPTQVYCCMFDIRLLSEAQLDAVDLRRLFQVGGALPSHTYLEGAAYVRMKDAFSRLHDEYGQPPGTPGRNGMLRSMLTEAALLFLRALAQSHLPAGPASDPASEAEQPFWAALQYVHVHYTEPLSLDAVARELHVSAAYVSRLFRKHTGQSLLRYVHQLRIESAAHLLAATDMPVSDITFASGFESFRTFARVFRELKGQTPSEYRSSRRPLQ